MLPYIAEFLGTMILIILGDELSRSHLHGDLRLCCRHLFSEQHREHRLIRR